jgi:anaerobic selenocysteine-containing dehydrogenase
MDRRKFLKVTAVTSTSATLASCGHPEHQLIRFVPDEEHVPGIAEWKPSLCPLCSAGCGLLVRVMEGDAEVVRHGETGLIKMGLAKKVEGNPAHPIAQGRLCARGQAALQLTYHPDRLTGPMKRSGPRGSGQFMPITWDVALGELISRLDALVSSGDQGTLAFLKRPGRGQRDELVSLFLERFGAPPAVTFELFSDDVLRRANLLSFGHEQLPTFDFARSRYVIGFGADFLGTWNSPVAQGIAYGQMRQDRPGVRGRFVQVEARMSQTGANADEWVPVRPGTEGILALGLAHVLINAGLAPAAAGRAGSLLDGWSAKLPDYAPAQVERRTGLSAARVERLARELADGGPAVALIGGPPLAHTNGLFHALAVNALNALLGSVGRPGGVMFMPELAPTGARRTRRLEQMAAELLGAGRPGVQVLLVQDANPVFDTPPAWKVRDALLKVPFMASFGSFLDETSILADLILPDHSFLESWVEGRPESGAPVFVQSLAPPAVHPLHLTRATPDVLLEVSRRLSPPMSPPLGWQTFEDMLRAAVATLPASSGPDDRWAAAQKRGGWWERAPASREARTVMPPSSAPAMRFAEAEFDGSERDYPFYFLPYASQAFLDGSLAHLPWLQELPDVMSTAMWSSWVEINPATARRLQIAHGDLVEVSSRYGSLRGPALVSPGIAPDVIGMPAGQGHETFTRYASGRGQNPVRLLAPLVDKETGALAWAATRVRISRVGPGRGELILFASEEPPDPFGRERE